MQSIKKYLAAVLCALFAASLALAETYKYDFATADAPVERGFTRITDQDSEDCRWLGKGESLSANAMLYGSHDLEKYKKRAPVFYLTDLSAGNIRGKYSASFQLPKVVPGKYRIWALCAYGGLQPKIVWDLHLQAGSGSGQLTFTGGNEIMELEFDTEVGSGGMSVTIASKGYWVLNALVAIPQDEWPAQRDGWLKGVREELFILPKVVRDTWQYTPVPCNLPEPSWNDQQKKDGFAIFTRHWSEPVYSTHFPAQKEIDAPVRAFAAWGEREILNFALYPMRSFENVNISVSDLVGEGNYRVMSEDIDLRYVRYMYTRPNYNITKIYYRVPDVLMPWKGGLHVPLGDSLRFWLTVTAPKNAPSGLYRGTATIIADGISAEVPLELRVLPIVLHKDESLTYGVYYHSPEEYLPSLTDGFSQSWHTQRSLKEHSFMQKWGFNSHNIHILLYEHNGLLLPDFDDFQRKMDIAMRHGITHPLPTGFCLPMIYKKHTGRDLPPGLLSLSLPPQSFYDDVTRIIGLIRVEAVRRHWPELLFYPVDEPSPSRVGMEFLRQTMEAIKRVPGTRTYVTADPALDGFRPLKPVVDIWCSQPYSIPREQVLKDMVERPGVEYWCYPNHISSENDHTLCKGARMTFGFGFWQSGYRALYPWHFGISKGSQWNYLDANYSDSNNRIDMDGSTIPTTLWYANAEGMDDGRYVYTLESLIARARDAGFEEAAAEALKALEYIRSLIHVQAKYKTENLWEAEAFDAYRWLLATKIIELQKLFGK